MFLYKGDVCMYVQNKKTTESVIFRLYMTHCQTNRLNYKQAVIYIYKVAKLRRSRKIKLAYAVSL